MIFAVVVIQAAKGVAEMKRKQIILKSWFLTLALTALLFAQPKPKPHGPIRQLHKPTGMTVHADTQHSDDKEHCFKEDNKRNLYFRVLTEIPAGRTYVDLYDLGDFSTPPAIVENRDAEIKNGLATVILEGHAVPSARASSDPEHLGPGPYVAVISAATSVDTKDRANTTTGISRYYYETFSSDPNECSH